MQHETPHEARGDVELRIGPAPAASAVAWVTKANTILDRLVASAAHLPFRLPLETVAVMRETLAKLLPCDAAVADHEHSSGEAVINLFDDASDPRGQSWVLSFDPGTLHEVIVYWFNITKLTEEQRARFGVVFHDPEADAFADALGGALGAAMIAHPDLAAFAERLGREWDECQPAFAAATAEAAPAPTP